MMDMFDDELNRGIDIEIDELTDCLENRKTGQIVETEYKEAILPLKPSDYKGWKFKWVETQKAGYHVFELYIKDNKEVQGRVSCKIDGGVADLDIIESAPHNVGHNGEYKGVGGHLFAIACEYSFQNGCDGFVAFIAKSDLIGYYQREIGAFLTAGRRMCIDTATAQKLVSKYLKKEEK